MIRIPENTACYGCGVCASACPRQIIAMDMNDEGFLVPRIGHPEACIECGICERVCSWLDDTEVIPLDRIAPKGFSAVNRSEQLLRASSSGGVAIEIARLCIDDGRKACGVRYNAKKKRAEHFVADRMDAYMDSLGSKYLQSHTVGAFRELMKQDCRCVIFGCPCQIDSLRRYARLKKKEADFFFVDFFCHGVPSDLLWQSYLREQTTHWGSGDIRQVSFRDKQNGWHRFTLKLETERGVHYSPLKRHDLFYGLFLGNQCLGKACYDCKFKLTHSAADLRIGDMWGRKYASDEQGVSGLLALTARGQEMVSRLDVSCHLRPERTEDVWEGQMRRTISLPVTRKQILRALYCERPLRSIYFRYGYKMYVKTVLPDSLKTRLKKWIRK